MTETAHKPQGVHLVGSVPLKNAEEVFRTASSILDDRLGRLPDGETGIRTNWIGWQEGVFNRQPQFEPVSPDRNPYTSLLLFQLRQGVKPEEIKFGSLGYAQVAKESYALFSRLKQAGEIPANYRFLVCLPTPIAPVAAFVRPDQQAMVESAYEARIREEVKEISAAIPASELAIQWDTAVEFGILEGVMPSFLSDPKNQIIERLVRLGQAIPEGVEMGYHLCYGDAGHRHFKEPEDTSKLAEIANAISEGVNRSINWIHMPVPRNRTDEAYFAPLRNLKLHPETKLYLGLVHYTDGVEGTQKRIEAAQKVVSDFGIATECGMGRRKAETIPDLMQIHASLAD